MDQISLPSIAAYLYELLRLPIDELTFELAFYSALGGLIWVVLGILGTRQRSLFPAKLQNLLEWIVESLEGWYATIMGSRELARRYVPLLGSFFLYILTLNYLPLIPFLHAPTSFLATTLSLALIAIVSTWIIAIQHLGFKGMLAHLAGVGEVPLPLTLLMFPLHLIGEGARILSLSVRLFANIFAEDTVLAAFLFVASTFLVTVAPIVLPVFFELLMIVFGFLQALVFSSLTAAYIAGWVAGHEHAHEYADGEG